ncbi:MAG: phage protease, partial [Opitutaceae bacterium]|nr:phage protease [Opitutaceae bacterium]
LPTHLTPLLNRAGELPADGWFHLVKNGDHPLSLKTREGFRRIVQRLDEKGCAAIVVDFRNRLGADPAFRVLVDFDHFSHDPGKSSEAAGWITAMENRADGIWFQADWSDAGRAAILNHRYRSISPAWRPSDCEQVAPGIYRPLRLRDAGLTNKPNLQGLTPFWNRESDPQPSNKQHKDIMNLQAIALALGLPETADEAAIIQAIKALTQGAAQTAPLQNRLTELEKKHGALLAESVTRELDANADVIPEAQKDAWRNRLENDFSGTAELLRGLKRTAPEKKPPVHDAAKAAAGAATKTRNSWAVKQACFFGIHYISKLSTFGDFIHAATGAVRTGAFTAIFSGA